MAIKEVKMWQTSSGTLRDTARGAFERDREERLWELIESRECGLSADCQKIARFLLENSDEVTKILLSKFDEEKATSSVKRPAATVESRVLEHIRSKRSEVSVDRISSTLGIKRDVVARTCGRLSRKGLIKFCEESGRYSAIHSPK